MKKTLPIIFAVFSLLIIIVIVLSQPKNYSVKLIDRQLVTKSGVCPPFFLYDEDGNKIDPVNKVNADKPYSPKQTC
jgi:hypothetical protein